MTTVMQDAKIAKEMEDNLEDIVKTEVKNSLDDLTERIFRGVDFAFLIDIICDEFQPDEIFSLDTLEEWALDHGFTKVAER